mgnify:FL=1
MHKEKHELAGKTVRIKDHVIHFQFEKFGGQLYNIEDWWDRVSEKSWKLCQGNPACLVYALRSAKSGLPLDDEVIYGYTEDKLGHLLHILEIEEIE